MMPDPNVRTPDLSASLEYKVAKVTLIVVSQQYYGRLFLVVRYLEALALSF